jgi:chemotaxis protein CheD
MTPKTAFNPAALTDDYMEKHGSPSPIKNSHFLLPGQMFASRGPLTVSTILGSCVAVCLWDQRVGVGGVNHYLLPEGESALPNRLRYANSANASLLEELLQLGAVMSNLEAKIVGGAHAHVSDENSASSLGTRNVQAAVDFLRSTGIPLIGKNVGGKKGRKLWFEIQTGDAKVELL